MVLLLTGGNIDPLAHSRVIERGLAADGRIYRFDVLLNDRAGKFGASVCRCWQKRGQT